MNKQKQLENICAFIVAGGQGSRLGEMGKHTQKCMLELWGKPMLYYNLISLKNAGCSKVIIAVNHLSEQVKDYFKDGKDLGIEIKYVEGNFKSTYDALYHSLAHLSNRILYIHANILFQNKLLKEIIALGNSHNKNIIAAVPNNAIELKHAQVSLDENNNVSAIDLNGFKSNYPCISLGVAYYKKQDIVKHFDGNSIGMVEKIIQQLLDANIKTMVYQYFGNWYHIETEKDYFEIIKKQFYFDG